ETGRLSPSGAARPKRTPVVGPAQGALPASRKLPEHHHGWNRRNGSRHSRSPARGDHVPSVLWLDPMKRDKLVGVLKAIPVAHRIVIGVAIVILVLAAKLFMGWASQPSYTVLSSGLDDKELASVINELEAQGVPYKVEGGGTRILVPQKDLATT